MNELEVFRSEYLKLCAKLNDTFERTDYKEHNRAMKRLEEMLKIIKTEPEKYGAVLADIMKNENTRAGITAAAHLMRLGIRRDEALFFLVKTAKAEKNIYLAAEAENIIEYVAEITLKEAKRQYGERGKIWNIIRS